MRPQRRNGGIAIGMLTAFMIVLTLLAAPVFGGRIDLLPSAVSAGDDEGEQDDSGGTQGGDAGNQGEGNGNEGGGNRGRGGGDDATADATAEATADATAVEIRGELGTATAQADGGDDGGEAVAPVETYRVEVECVYEAADDQTGCTFVGVADGGGAAVRRIALPVTALCAPVVGGDPAYVTADAASRIPGGRAEANREGLRLVLAGRVTTEGEATYWVTADPGLAPARGPGFACADRPARDPEAAVSDSVGAIMVQALACSTVTDAATFDWFGACTDPAAAAEFELEVQDGTGFVPQDSGTVAADGRLRFAQLPPGTYRLTQTNATWCHAESDSVNDRGEVLVEAGRRSSVWVFNCTRRAAEATASPVP